MTAKEIRELGARELRECAQRLGHSPSMAEFLADPHTTLHPQVIAKAHGKGGWNEAKRRVGLAVRRHATDEEMLEGLRALGERLGHAPSAREINAAEGLPSAALYVQRFGSLSAAHQRAGFVPAAQRTSAAFMVQCGLALAQQLGHLPSWSEWEAAREADPEIPSQWQVYRRFGGGEGAWRLFTYYLLEAAAEHGLQLVETA